MKFLIIVFILCSCALATSAQYKNIKIDDTGNPTEPSIVINPKFPNKVVAGAAPDKSYYSDDFGHTWKIKNINSRDGVFGSPCIIADNEGMFYYFHLSDPEKTGWKSTRVLDRIVGHYSKNGKRWGSGVPIGLNYPKQQDKEWAAYDEYSNNIYLTWTQFDKYDSESPLDSSNIMFTYSSDRGKSWQPVIRINQIAGNCRSGNATTNGAMPAAGPRGEVYVTWALNEKIYFDKSIDGGIMWLRKDKVIAEQPGGWDLKVPGINKCNGLPVIACDLSYGQYHGNIYVSWADQRNGEDNTDIWFVKSTDSGNSWTVPKRINDDQSGRHQFMSWMTIDQVSGHIYTIFYDRRSHEDNHTDVYLAFSEDGGETFINKKISENPFLPEDDIYFGNHINISAFSGYIRPAWTRVDNGKTSVWTAIIDIF